MFARSVIQSPSINLRHAVIILPLSCVVYPKDYLVYAYSLTRQHADAADLTQQTTIILATRWHEIRDRERVKPWLFSVLHREFLRSKRRGARFVALDEPSAEAITCEQANQETSHDSNQVVRMIHSMDEPHRSVLSHTTLTNYPIATSPRCWKFPSAP